jgi:predicted transcriptional regulator
MSRSKGCKNLTRKDKSEILKLYGSGKYNQVEIAEMLGVSPASVTVVLDKYMIDRAELGEDEVEAAKEALRKSLREFNAYEATTQLTVMYTQKAKETIDDEDKSRVYGKLSKDFIKLLTELRGEYEQTYNIDVTTWDGTKVLEILEGIFKDEDK